MTSSLLDLQTLAKGTIDLLPARAREGIEAGATRSAPAARSAAMRSQLKGD